MGGVPKAHSRAPSTNTCAALVVLVVVLLRSGFLPVVFG